jgi:hypothetical protein
MKRRRPAPTDSLDLLLDTMCNTFGGIILIAILVALLARQTPSPLVAAEQASSAMIVRRLATAAADLAEAQQLHDKLAANPRPTADAAQREKQQLEEALRAGEAEAGALAGQAGEKIQAQTNDPGGEIKSLRARQQALERETTEVQNAIKAQEQNAQRLAARIADIDRQIQKDQEARIVKLRFPKERTSSKSAVPLMCKFGKVYPLRDADLRRENRMVAWESVGDGEIGRPIESSGWSLPADQATLGELLRSAAGKDRYIVFFVYPDSVETYRTARDRAVAQSLDIGLELLGAGVDITWGPGGTIPPPL